MDIFLLRIDRYINEETPDFWQFYNWFQDAYFGDQHSKVRNHLQQDEKDFLDTVNDLLAYAGADPTPEERNDGISDQYEFQQQLKRPQRSKRLPLDAIRPALIVRTQLRIKTGRPPVLPPALPMPHDCSPFDPCLAQNPRPLPSPKCVVHSRKIRDRVCAPTFQYS